jgi:hypothetical protein
LIRLVVNNELEGMGKQRVVAYFEMLFLAFARRYQRKASGTE